MKISVEVPPARSYDPVCISSMSFWVALFRELIFQAPNLRVDGPEYLVGNFVRAVKSLPYTLDKENS